MPFGIRGASVGLPTFCCVLHADVNKLVPGSRDLRRKSVSVLVRYNRDNSGWKSESRTKLTDPITPLIQIISKQEEIVKFC